MIYLQLQESSTNLMLTFKSSNKTNGLPKIYQTVQTRVCANTSSYEERLNFLLQFTSGEANRIVTGYSHLDAERGYLQALDELKDRYGDPDVVAQTYVKKALNWPAIKPDNSKALDSYAIFLTECQFAVKNVDSARSSAWIFGKYEIPN